MLAGDSHQLRSLIQNPYAKELETSLLEVVQEEFGRSTTILLNEQYRMNEKIQNWSSKAFYNSELRPHESVENIQLSDISPFFDDSLFSPLVFVDTDLSPSGAIEKYHKDSLSFSNPFEAEIVVEHLERLITGGLMPEQIGVITGYREQVLLIRRMLGKYFISN